MIWFQGGVLAAMLWLVGVPEKWGWFLLIAILGNAWWRYGQAVYLGQRAFSFRADMTGPEFEQNCAAALRSAGWAARTTRGSGDQGVDVIAKKNGIKVAIQCKRYAKPVGNRAVQEALAGKHFINAHWAAVVSNAAYTQSARDLASASGVRLLHYTDLMNADRLFTPRL